MTIAGFEIFTCPYCSQLYKNSIIGSYNNIRSNSFSDGYVEGPFIPKIQSIIKCINNACSKFFNIKDKKVIAKLDFEDFNNPEWKDAYYLSMYNIGISELEEALQKDFCKNQDNEVAVRELLLQRYNDVYRKNREYEMSKEEKNKFLLNIDKLIELYRNDSLPIDRLFLSELYREKGDFASCIAILHEMKNVYIPD